MTTQRHLTREDWVAFARKTLVQSGIDDVKVDRLATKMKVSRGSFYWHFQHRKDLLDALLQDWEVRNHVEIAQVRDRWARDKPDLSEVIAIWLGEDPNFPAFDTAVRFWARKSAPVADACHRVDAAWVALLEELFLQGGYAGEEALVRARIVYFHQIGYYALAVREDLADRLRRVPLYYKALTGEEPGPSLDAVLERFRQLQAPAVRKAAKKPVPAK